MKTKGFVRACAFGSVCIFVIILLLTVGLSVSAAEQIPFYLAQRYNLTSNDILTTTGFTLSGVDTSNADLTNICPSKPYGNLYDYTGRIGEVLSDIQYENNSLTYDSPYFISVSFLNQQLTTYCLPAGSIVNTYGYQMDIFVPYDTGITSLYGSAWDCYNNQSAGDVTAGFDGDILIDGTRYYYYEWGLTANWTYIYMCNAPIYSVYNIINTGSFGDAQLNYTDAYNSAVVTGEGADNNLYMPDADFAFKNTNFTAPYNVNFNTGSIYPNGNITFSYFPTDYQIEHSSNFKVRLSFSFDYDVNYKNYSAPFSVFEQTSDLTENMKNYHARWYYDSGDLNYIYVELSDFISSGNSVSYTFEDILSNCSNRDTGYEAVLSNSKELNYIEYNKFNINCTAEIISNGSPSGSYTEWYNPMNKKGYTTDTSGKKNNNPYEGNNNSDVVPSGAGAGGTAGVNGDNSNNIGGGSNSSSGSSDAYSSVGNITINNNNTAYGGTGNGGTGNGGNGNGGGGSGGSETSTAAISFWNTFNPFKLIFNKLTGDVTDISDDVAETLGANGYITVLSTTFGFLPAECWTVLTWFLGATLAILIVGVILRILLDLL